MSKFHKSLVNSQTESSELADAIKRFGETERKGGGGKKENGQIQKSSSSHRNWRRPGFLITASNRSELGSSISSRRVKETGSCIVNEAEA